MNGNAPGSPRLAAVRVGGRVGRADLDPGVGEAPRVVRADDRRDGEVGRLAVLERHGSGGYPGARPRIAGTVRRVIGVRAARDGWGLVRDALATPELRRVQLAFGACAVAHWAFYLIISIYAYDYGGAAAVGVAALARLLPAGLAAPVRRPARRPALAPRPAASPPPPCAPVSRLLVMATVLADGPFALVLALAALQGVVTTVLRPAPGGAAAAAGAHAAGGRRGQRVHQRARQRGLAGRRRSPAGCWSPAPGVGWAFGATAVPMALAALLLCGVPRDAVPAVSRGAAGARRLPSRRRCAARSGAGRSRGCG